MTDKARQEPRSLPAMQQVGRPLRRVDALGKTTGATAYAADYEMPRMLHAKVFRSGEPSARIAALDVSQARALGGVECVLTAEDLPGARLATDMPGQTGQEERKGTKAPVLASSRVRFIGEPIALVAAETLAIAERALELIAIEYEPIPGVYDPLEAMKPDAPVVYAPDNVVATWRINKGDVEAGLAAADHVVENTFTTHFVEHAYLEPEAGVAWIDDQDVINIRVCTQVVEHFRSIAEAVGVPHNKVHVRGTMIGGGFGGKEDITVEIFLALLTQATRRPVKLVYTREESILAHSKRHPFIITHRTGVREDGRITAAEIEMIANAGAYPYLSPYVALYATVTAAGPYRIENIRVDTRAVATNNPFTSAFRGFGAAQAAVAYEQQMDEVAKAIGMDPLEFRKVNFFETGDANAIGQRIESAVWLEDEATRALAALGERTPDTGAIKIGRGLATTMQSYGRIMWFHDTARSWVGLEQDGTVVIRCGAPDLGGGQVSSLCQIAAEVLGVPMDDVRVYNSDSALTPLAGTTTATRQLFMSGNATLKASRMVRDVLVERAAQQLGVRPEGIDLADRQAFVKSDPHRGLPLSDLAKMCAADGMKLQHLALFTAPFTDQLDPEDLRGDLFPDFTFSAHAVEVAVDTETGQVTVLKSVGCHDVGRAINPTAVEGQIQGGSAQGIGWALMEELKVEQGRPQAPSLSEYLIPTAKDLPKTQAIILESGTGVGPFGAKGIGEPALTPAAPAVANAVADAIGVRIHDLPITPERVLKALDRKKS
ncbi:MAG: xanthine dehydrogenase family protein molybdopterin-binding subunit [Chloroflexota bacterium]